MKQKRRMKIKLLEKNSEVHKTFIYFTSTFDCGMPKMSDIFGFHKSRTKSITTSNLIILWLFNIVSYFEQL